MTMCGEVARGMGEVRLIPVCAGASSLVTLASAVATIAWAGMGVTGYFASVTVGPAVAIALYLSLGGLGPAALRGARQLVSSSGAAAWSLVRPMLRYALPLIPNSLFWWLGSGINRLFITGMLGIAASGLFAAASKVPNLLNTAYSIFQQAWQLSAFQESGEEGLARFFSRVFALVQAGMTVLCAALSFAAPWVASVLLRGETYDAWPMIAPLLISNLFNVPRLLLRNRLLDDHAHDLHHGDDGAGRALLRRAHPAPRPPHGHVRGLRGVGAWAGGPSSSLERSTPGGTCALTRAGGSSSPRCSFSWRRPS